MGLLENTAWAGAQGSSGSGANFPSWLFRKPIAAQDPAGFPIDMLRPIMRDPQGGWETEKSITLMEPWFNSGRPTNIPTIWGGQHLGEEDAIGRALQELQRGYQFPNFGTLEEAIEAAKARSRHIGLLRGPEAKRRGLLGAD